MDVADRSGRAIHLRGARDHVVTGIVSLAANNNAQPARDAMRPAARVLART